MIAALPPEVKAATVKAGKANNQSALLEAAKSAPEKQAVAVASYKSAKKTPSGFAKPPATSSALRIMVTDNIRAALYHLEDATKSLNVEMSAGEADAIKEAFLAVGDIARRGAALAERAAQAVTSINKPSVADKLMAQVLNTEGRQSGRRIPSHTRPRRRGRRNADGRSSHWHRYWRAVAVLDQSGTRDARLPEMSIENTPKKKSNRGKMAQHSLFATFGGFY